MIDGQVDNAAWETDFSLVISGTLIISELGQLRKAKIFIQASFTINSQFGFGCWKGLYSDFRPLCSAHCIYLGGNIFEV
jgi:hypothetical protein